MDNKSDFPEGNQKDIISQKENKIENIQTTPENNETLNIAENGQNKNVEEKNADKNFSKLSQLIKKRNYSSSSKLFILSSIFNLWKNKTFIKEETIERRTKKLLIKKTLNLKRESIKSEKEKNEKKKTIKIPKQITPIKSNEEIKKKKRIIKFIETRISSYVPKKDILKKYYDRWTSKIFTEDEIKTILSKKKIFFFRKPDEDGLIENQNQINIEQNDEEKNNKDIIDISPNQSSIIDKNSFLQNVIKNKESLAIYFNYWKRISGFEKVETTTKKKKILIKKTKIKNEVEENYLPKIIKILKQTGENKNNEKNKRKKQLIKFIESRITSYKTDKDILRKYYDRWISNSFIGIEKQINNSKIKITQIMKKESISEKENENEIMTDEKNINENVNEEKNIITDKDKTEEIKINDSKEKNILLIKENINKIKEKE